MTRPCCSDSSGGDCMSFSVLFVSVDFKRKVFFISCSPVPSSYQRQRQRQHHQSHPHLPWLPALPHQVLQGEFSFTHTHTHGWHNEMYAIPHYTRFIQQLSNLIPQTVFSSRTHTARKRNHYRRLTLLFEETTSCSKGLWKRMGWNIWRVQWLAGTLFDDVILKNINGK